GVRPRVFGDGTHVGPVALSDVPKERLALREETREEVLAEVEDLAETETVEDSRFDDIDPGVDRVAEDLAPGRVLEELDDAAVPVAVLDNRGQVLKGDERVLDAVTLEELEDVPEARLVDDGHHRLRTIDRQRSKTAPLAARHDDGLHWRESSSAFLRSDREERLEVVAGVGLKRHVCLRPRDARHLGDPPGHDVS